MNSYLLMLAVLSAAAVAMPRYALVPVEDLMQHRPQVRSARGVSYDEVEAIQYAPSDNRYVRQAGPSGYDHGPSNYDQVDYGAYTGGYGAFGWYTDHPVYSYGNSYGH